MNDLWIPLLPFAFFAWLLFMGRGKACPNCNKPLPPFQSPFTKTKRQWWKGGYLCQNCGCETDIAGNKVAAGVGPRRRSIVIGIGLMTLAVVPAFILWTVILHR